jgi:hypothetical protein
MKKLDNIKFRRKGNFCIISNMENLFNKQYKIQVHSEFDESEIEEKGLVSSDEETVLNYFTTASIEIIEKRYILGRSIGIKDFMASVWFILSHIPLDEDLAVPLLLTVSTNGKESKIAHRITMILSKTKVLILDVMFNYYYEISLSDVQSFIEKNYKSVHGISMILENFYEKDFNHFYKQNQLENETD